MFFLCKDESPNFFAPVANRLGTTAPAQHSTPADPNFLLTSI